MVTSPPAKLHAYRSKRSTDRTPEPFARLRIPATGTLFVVQQHAARHLHFDLRLEMDGVLRSWAVPKGPSTCVADKRFAALVEDHPLDYADFEGHIPDGNYGAGEVIVWDRGTWKPLKDIRRGFTEGKLLFELSGYKLRGRWTLVRIKDQKAKRPDDGKSWLLIKERDQWATKDTPDWDHSSVLSGLTVSQRKKPAEAERRLIRAVKKLEGIRPDKDRTAPPAPMLATPGEAGDRNHWLFEFKYDGYRILAAKQGGHVTLFSRNGHDLTHRFPEIAQAVSYLPCANCLVDGELVANNAAGLPSFSHLQQRARLTDELQVAQAAITAPCTYYAFDLLSLADYDLRDCALIDRKRLLKRLLPACGALVYSEHNLRHGLATMKAARKLGLEGVVGKDSRSVYRSGRSDAWIKVRSDRHDDFVIVGWLASRGHTDDLGSLALAEMRNGQLTYVGRVGSGFTADQRRSLLALMTRLQRKTPPLVLPDSTGSQDRVHWVKPSLVCEVRFKEYTRDGHLRHPVYARLREDKNPDECTGHFLTAESAPLAKAPAPTVEITNPDKVFFPEKNITKSAVVKYYEAVSRWMLPYLADRPVVLTRYPDGVNGKSFYQRDAPDFVPDWIRREVLWSESTDREVSYFIVDDTATLMYLANMGTLPIHVWHSRIQSLEHPDWCVLDLDPKSAPFTDVVTLARAIGELTEEIDLPSFVKTSGASGLHILMPLGNQLTHEQSRSLAELLARVIVGRYPDISTIARSVGRRAGKVYLDYLQNGHGRLIAAPLCVRAEAAASVSMPITFSELNARLGNPRFHVANAIARLKRKGDPMAPLLTANSDLARSLAQLTKVINDN